MDTIEEIQHLRARVKELEEERDYWHKGFNIRSERMRQAEAERDQLSECLKALWHNENIRRIIGYEEVQTEASDE